ncbi:MAG TPA: M1 family metallopeptidase, partial [Cytophagales bacterium]|nr:M1 family metallopeptidase [Cytophagales bacterium]
MKTFLHFSFILISSACIAQTAPGTSCALNKRSAHAHARVASHSAALADTSIDVRHYKLDLKLSYDFTATAPYYMYKHLQGSVTIKAQNLKDTNHKIHLNLRNAGLTVDSVFVKGVNHTFVHNEDLIQIPLPKSLQKDEVFTITVHYHGLPEATGFGSFIFATHGNPAKPAIHSLSQPYGAADWFPCKNDPSDKADSSEVWITAPSELISVSNGILQGITTQGAYKTYQWKTKYPIAQYLIFIASAQYDLYEDVYHDSTTTKHMPITHYLFPEINTIENKGLMDETNYMMKLFSNRFGPYPFLDEKYGHAIIAIQGGGMEHQTCSSMSDFGSGLVAHELAHQWFGDKITCASWEHIWLNEGFATYAELIYSENKKGRDDYNYIMSLLMASARTAHGSLYVTSTEINEIFSSNRTYHKGAVVLHMLRNIVGDTTFFDILKTYMSSSHAYGNATTEDFQAIAEKVSGQNLDYFFSQWIYGSNYPKYKVGIKIDTVPDNQHMYTVHMRVVQAPTNPNPSFFTMPIKLRITLVDSSYQDIRVFNNQP